VTEIFDLGDITKAIVGIGLSGNIVGIDDLRLTV
jgi:hypothetical protein